MIRSLIVAALLLSPSIAAAAPNGSTCSLASQCDSGFCVDDICCGSACSGQCEACDVKGSEGACVAVVGAPHGARPGCMSPSPSGNVCARTTCDGTDRIKCAAYVGPSTICRAGACVDGSAIPETRCDGAGSCPAATPVACGGYTCALTTCRTTCTSIADCASGFACRSGACVPTGSTCSADGLSAVSPEGTTALCAPYRCFGGNCLAACAPGRDSDCQTGLVCALDGRCVDPASLQKEEEEGGCAYAPRGSASFAAFALLAALAARRLRG